MGKIQCFSACRGEEYFTAPHNTSRRGGISFTTAPPLPHRRDKNRPARLHQRPGGTKLTQHAQNAPKRAISGEQGEFCTGSGPAQLEQGEFCTGSGPTRSLAASIASPRHRPCLQLPTSRHPRAPQPGPGVPSASSALLAVGVLHYTKPSGGVSPACRSLM